MTTALSSAGLDAGLILALLIILFVVAGITAAGGALSERARPTEPDPLFLCPECLRFAPVSRGCPGGSTDRCPHCGALSEAAQTDRQVVVLAVLTRGDLEKFCRATHGENWTIRERYAMTDNGRRRTYLLPLEAFADEDAPLPVEHALFAVRLLWSAGEGSDPIEAGQVLDHVLRRTGWTAQKRGTIQPCLASADLTLAERLSALFRPVLADVAARDLMREPDVTGSVAGDAPPRILVVPTEQNWEILRRIRDRYDEALIGEGVFRNSVGRATRVLCLERCGEVGEQAPADLAHTEAVWIGKGTDLLLLGQALDRFLRIRPSGQEVVACLEPGTSEAIESRVRAHFRRVRREITAAEFLQHGAQAQPELAAEPRVTRVLGALRAEDFQALVAEMSGERERLECGWIAEQWRNRLTYLVPLGNGRALETGLGPQDVMLRID
ncbi:MAG TPA: hypothetical protein VFU47_05105, partial [Armatimonadota bacterium]|nr:hypothetical protein [Armatimonadota bacterium]